MVASLVRGAVAATLLAPLPAQAISVQIDFAGTITDVFDDGISDGSVLVGGPFSGSVILDLAASPSDTSPGQARYIFATPPYAYSAAFGNYAVVNGALDSSDPLSPDAFQVALVDGIQQSNDSAAVFAAASFLVGAPQNLDTADFMLALTGTSSTVLSSTSLSDVPWDLGAWEVASFDFTMSDTDGLFFSLHGSVESMTVTSLPEPRWLALPVVGLLALTRSRSRHALQPSERPIRTTA